MDKIKTIIKKMPIWILIIIGIIIVVIVANIIKNISDKEEMAYGQKQQEEEIRRIEEEGFINTDGVYTFNFKVQDLYERLKTDYYNIYDENYSVDLSLDNNGWFVLKLSVYENYLGGNYYTKEATTKLFKTISTHNGYIKEIELTYNTTSEGGMTDVTYILFKHFAELSGVDWSNLKSQDEYIEYKQNVVGNLLSSNHYWENDSFALAIQYARPGDYIYGLPRNSKTSENGISYIIKVTDKYDTQECNNSSGNKKQENNDTVNNDTSNTLENNPTHSAEEYEEQKQIEDEENSKTTATNPAPDNSSSSTNNKPITNNSNSNNSNNNNNNETKPPEVTMPNLVGLSVAQAEQKLNELGIGYTLETVATLTKTENVISQSIPVGTKKSEIYTNVTIKAYKKVSVYTTVYVKLLGGTEESKAFVDESNDLGIKAKVTLNGQESERTIYHGTERFYFNNVNNSTSTIKVYIKDKLIVTKNVNIEDIMEEENGNYYAYVTIEI